MGKEQIISKEFYQQLRRDFTADYVSSCLEEAALNLQSFPPEFAKNISPKTKANDLERMIQNSIIERLKPEFIRWFSLPKSDKERFVRNGLSLLDYNNSQKIQNSLLQIFTRWKNFSELLPRIELKQICRATGLTIEQASNLINQGLVEITINNQPMVAKIDQQKANIPIKKAIREAVKDTVKKRRKRNLRKAVRGKLTSKELRKKIGSETAENSLITFIRKEETTIKSEPKKLQKEKPPSLKEQAFGEINGEKIWEVFNWFKEIGFGGKWVYGSRERLFLEDLIALSKGETVDFQIWNCIGFEWFENPTGDYPFCDLNDNLDVAIAWYFKNRIVEIASRLSKLGQANLVILIPSNEAFYEKMWNYRQSQNEREQIINRTRDWLNEKFFTIEIPKNATIAAMRWDEYLISRGITDDPQTFSEQGEQRIIISSNYKEILEEAVRNGLAYFKKNKVSVNPRLIAPRRIRYYGVYAGEGIVSKFMRLVLKRRIVVLNFEEMRIAKMEDLGADGNISIITPAKGEEIEKYYQFENETVQRRKNAKR